MRNQQYVVLRVQSPGHFRPWETERCQEPIIDNSHPDLLAFQAWDEPKGASEGGLIYRGHARLPVIEDDVDYEASERILFEVVQRMRTDLLSFCQD